MSEYNKSYKLDGEHIYKGAHLPGFSPTWLLDEIENYEFDDDDVLIATYSKCGIFFLMYCIVTMLLILSYRQLV